MLRKSFLFGAILISTMFAMLVLPPAVSYASCENPVDTQEAIRCGACQSSGTCGQDPVKPINSTIARAINLLSLGVGIIAVIMIIVGGFRYISSGGAQDKVASAKNTIIYAVIGLIVAGIAQVAVKFITKEVSNTTIHGSSISANTRPEMERVFYISGLTVI